ncbi:hypothetical protein [Arenimonas malthae]|nr:hypothetical protein [Arenimonas malthae]
MRKMLLLSFALAALFSGSVLAQSFSSLEERMTEAEFKAAGLDKLSPEELARLNAFIAGETGKAASALPAATPAQDLRGFDQRTGADGSIYTSITGEFKGWNKQGQRFRFDNGQIWQITDSTSRLKVSLVNPEIIIEPGALGAWYMKVVGYNTRARVKRIK